MLLVAHLHSTLGIPNKTKQESKLTKGAVSGDFEDRNKQSSLGFVRVVE
jgi:hypothetical protein